MIETIGEVMRACRHYFPADYQDGEWSLEGGMLLPESEMTDGLIAITGSAGHNGVWMLRNGCIDTMTDERWNGRVWLLAPPEDFLNICRAIESWRATHPAKTVAGERFGEYSVQYATGGQSKPGDWRDAFGERLRPYQRMFAEVPL